MKEKIKELTEAILIIGARRANDTLNHDSAKELISQHIDSMTARLESLFKEHSALMCEEQKRICLENFQFALGQANLGLDPEKCILNAPLPSEIGDMVVMSKEEFNYLLNLFYQGGSLKEYNDHFGKIPNLWPTFEELKKRNNL
jgi:hypothetical protein